MKILLFNQYFTSERGSQEKNFASVPLNLLSLGSYLKAKGMDCKIFELGIFDESQEIAEGDKKVRQGISDEKIKEIIKSEKPRVIGMGCMYSRHYIDVVNIAKLIKETDPSIKVVIGGNHATDLCDLVLKSPYFDFIVLGEGEMTFFELCRAILDGKDVSGVNGLAYRENGEVIKTEPRDFIQNLDDLPMLDYSLIDLKKYLKNAESPYVMRPPVMGISSSRGCPGRCVYCTVKAVWGHRWRAKSAKRTVDEIEALNKDYGIREFSFLDDSASVNKVRWNEVCDEIIKRGLDIRWSTPNGIAHWTLDKDILLKMKKAGCYRITFGIESGDIEVRKFVGKPYPLSQARELLQYANRIGMWTICTHIIGFPYETREQINNTIEFAKKSDTDFAAFYPLSPMPTSNVYQYFKKENLLNFDAIFGAEELDVEKYEDMYKMLNEGGAPTVNFKPQELKKIIAHAYKSFIFYRGLTFLNPLRIIRKIHSLEDFRYTSRLIFTGAKLFVKSFYKKTTQTLLR